jgi:predicted esterase
MRHSLAAAVLLAAGTPVFSQNFDPPPAKAPDAATLKQIADRTAQLKAAVAAVVNDLPEVHRADLEVYVKAVEWIVRHQEWYTADSGKQTLAVIDQGIKRAESARGGKTPWLEPKGRAVARGYRSEIDGSVQPYGVVYPHGYGSDPKKKWRLDISLHGRDGSLTEVKHLNQHNAKEAPKDQEFVQINIYGRGNNAYRWAGESDVFEAMDHFLKAEAAAGRKDTIDLRRVVLKGFSMGGAGTWHLGLRHPDRFAVIQPGAGFTTTHGYIGKLPDPLPDYQEKCLTIYDAYRYAENAFDVPVVAYSGEIDKQRQAAENIQAELKRLGLSDHMTHLIGPGLEHKFPPEWQKTAETELRKYAGKGKGREQYPKHVRFVTYSLKQSRCDWITVLSLDKHYERAIVDATSEGGAFRVTTRNIRRFELTTPHGIPAAKSITVDGQAVALGIGALDPCVLRRGQDGWFVERVSDGPPRREKEPGLQGPIDDAFTGQFLCVVGTGKPDHPEIDRAALAQLDRFRREWDKYMRGVLPVKKDTEVTDEDKRHCHLILFGDPGSNALIREALPKLPLKWTTDALELGGVRYEAATHLPLAIQPGPYGNGRYVVLNSGHTFHDADFRGTNALLYPRLGDYAIVKPTPTAKDPAAFEVVTAGLFDERWQLPKK